jgi:hypothetical protein
MGIKKNSMERNQYKVTSVFRNAIIIPLLFIGHLFYELIVGHFLFKLAGGIREYPNGRWTELGGINWAFETPLYTPGSFLMAKSNIGPCMWDGSPWGLLLIVIATTLTAIFTGQLIQKIINKDNDKFGRYYWRLVIVLLGWVFIPVPVEMTMTYEFTVLC